MGRKLRERERVESEISLVRFLTMKGVFYLLLYRNKFKLGFVAVVFYTVL
jgi:hypothetical protein